MTLTCQMYIPNWYDEYYSKYWMLPIFQPIRVRFFSDIKEDENEEKQQEINKELLERNVNIKQSITRGRRTTETTEQNIA